MSKQSWFSQGQEGEERAKQDEEDRARKAGAFRLWLPPGGSTEFTFLDTEGFFFREHNFYHNKSWMNWETCIQDIGEEDCPFCEAGVKYFYECVFTVIDHAEYVSKRTQKVVKDTKKLLVLRSTARKKVLRKKDQQDGDLTYCRFSVNRDSAQECSTGEDFDFIHRATREDVLRYAPTEYMGKAITASEWIKPFDYMAIFQPKKAEQLRRILGKVPEPTGAGDSPNFRSDTQRNGTSGQQQEDAVGGGDKPSVQSLI
jgi:hypothetical protein